MQKIFPLVLKWIIQIIVFLSCKRYEKCTAPLKLRKNEQNVNRWQNNQTQFTSELCWVRIPVTIKGIFRRKSVRDQTVQNIGAQKDVTTKLSSSLNARKWVSVNGMG